MAALNFTSATKPFFGNNHNFFPKTKDHFKLNCPPWLHSLRSCIAAQSQSESDSEGRQYYSSDSGSEIAEGLSARAQMDLLEQLTSSSSGSSSGVGKRTIREQLAELVGDRDDDFSIPLGKNLKKVSPKFLTTSQKRNIRRQDYLNQVSQRNDSVFFATIGGFVILPPFLILGIAILTGYVQLFP